MKRGIFIILALVLAAPAAYADAHQVRYVGVHPIPKSEGGGFCYIEGPHVHIYGADKVQYRDHRGENYFVGDPVAYGYDGPRYTYKGHHPIHVDAVVEDGDPDTEWCYLDGPHYHYFAPPSGPEFTVAGDAYFYVGEPPHVYVEGRPTYMRINTMYQPMVYERPVVTVGPPVGWIGARAEFAVVTPGVAVVAPGAAVVAPGVAVGVGIGVVVPPPPSVHVGVEIGVPGVVVHERPVIIEERRHHDNGEHRGWHKR